ncbi:hypothetical protein Gogos_021644, partial [Gossypium gossypioides]|nr:hypothetical protein [Gossypium gossypioides]
QASCRLSEFLKHHEVKLLNKLLPCQPFSKEFNNEAPLLVCQVTIFACGRIALGVVFSHYLSKVENLWFTEPYNSITMRFTFDAKSIAELRAIAKGELEAMPSRIQAVLGFIWKRSMAASRMISGSFKPFVLAQAIDTELFELVKLMRKSIATINDE